MLFFTLLTCSYILKVIMYSCRRIIYDYEFDSVYGKLDLYSIGSFSCVNLNVYTIVTA